MTRAPERQQSQLDSQPPAKKPRFWTDIDMYPPVSINSTFYYPEHVSRTQYPMAPPPSPGSPPSSSAWKKLTLASSPPPRNFPRLPEAISLAILQNALGTLRALLCSSSTHSAAAAMPSTTALLLPAIRHRRLKIIEFLLQRDPAYTPATSVIEEVVRCREGKMLRLFLRPGEFNSIKWPKLNLGDKSEQGDILGWAIRVGHVGLFDELINTSGVYPTHMYRNKISHLELCFSEMNIACHSAEGLAELLLDSGNAEISGSEALQTVCALTPHPTQGLLVDDVISAIDFLISSGADIDEVAPNQQKEGNLSNDSEEDETLRGMTPLTAAVAVENFEVVKHLLNRCADPHKPDAAGRYAMSLAMSIDWERGMQLLTDWEGGWRGDELGTIDYRAAELDDKIAPSRRDLTRTLLKNVGNQYWRTTEITKIKENRIELNDLPVREEVDLGQDSEW